jgi:hypothetical protein
LHICDVCEPHAVVLEGVPISADYGTSMTDDLLQHARRYQPSKHVRDPDHPRVQDFAGKVADGAYIAQDQDTRS